MDVNMVGFRLTVLVVLLACGIAVYATANSLQQVPRALSQASFWTAAWGFAFAAMMSTALLLGANNEKQFLIWFTVAAAGGALGWGLGIVASPSTPDEAAQFTSLRTTVVSLASGAIATQLGAFWSKLIDGADPLILKPDYGLPVLIFLACMLVSIGVQYNMRQYAAPAITIAVQSPSQVPVSPAGLPIWYGEDDMVFTGLVAHPQDSRVEWRLDVLDSPQKSGKFRISEEGRLTAVKKNDADFDGKPLGIVAVSRWNHVWSKRFLIQLGE